MPNLRQPEHEAFLSDCDPKEHGRFTSSLDYANDDDRGRAPLRHVSSLLLDSACTPSSDVFPVFQEARKQALNIFSLCSAAGYERVAADQQLSWSVEPCGALWGVVGIVIGN